MLDRVAALYGHTFQYTDVDMGGCAIDKWGDPLPQEMLEKCLQSDSVLLGAVGGDKWNDLPAQMRPEKGLLRLRAGMGVYSNNRPAKIWPQLADASPLKKSVVGQGHRLHHRQGADWRHLFRRAQNRRRAGSAGRHRPAGLSRERD